jgi:hypothetical protein
MDIRSQLNTSAYLSLNLVQRHQFYKHKETKSQHDAGLLSRLSAAPLKLLIRLGDF